jgi:GPH family glycoside/pentoside/hexuronide:cation symporter
VTDRTAAKPLSLPRLLAFSSAYVPISAFILAVTVHLPRYFAAHMGLTLTVVGVTFGLVRFVDIPLDAVFGVLMDRTRTRIGRFRPWIIAGAPLLMLGLYMLVNAPQGVGQGYLFGWVLAMYIGYSIVYLALLAWGGAIAATYEQRNRVFGALSGLGVIGAMAVLLIPVAAVTRFHATDAQGVQAMVWAMIVTLPIAAAMALVFTPDAPGVHGRQGFRLADYLLLLGRGNVIRVLVADLTVTLGPGWMAALYLFYFKDSRGFGTAAANLLLLIYIAAGFVGSPFAAWLGNRIGKHRALIANTTVYSLGLIVLPLTPKGNFIAHAPGMFVLGAMAAGFTVLIRAITADIADEVKLDTGREYMGLMYAITTATTKIATASSLLIAFPLLDRIGYAAREGAANTPAAIQGLQLVYIIGPIVFVMIAGGCFLGYRLTAQRHADIRRQLDTREALADPAAAAESLTGDAGAAAVTTPG